MKMRIVRVLTAAFLSAATLGACSGGEPLEATAAQEEAVGLRPVDPDTGQPVNPTTGLPVDDYPLGYCTYVCSLGKRRVAMTNRCKTGGVCDDLSNEECTQTWRTTPFDDRACAGEVQRSCVNPNLKLP
jgi:hypothetical protein